MVKKIQKHISIPGNDWEIIKEGLNRNGQKLSPVCNMLLREYFKILKYGGSN